MKNSAVRKLVWTAAGYAAALALALYVLPEALLLPASACCALLGLAGLGLRFVRRLRRPGTAAALAAFGAALGFGWFFGYTALLLRPADAFAGEKRTVEVEILGYAGGGEGYARVDARSVDAVVPHVRMSISSYDGGFGGLRPGDRVSMPLKLLSAGKQYGLDSDYYLSGGILLRGYTTGDYTVTGRSPYAGLLFFPQELARTVREQALRCFPDDVAPLMKALLSGDRSELAAGEGLYSALKTAGMAHIVAVSGMHIAFLMGLLRMLTGRRRITAFLGIPLIVVFMAMVGFTPSVLRAGVMMILLLLAPLLRRENDPPTALATAGLLILLANPYAVGSMSFQLSFAAMAGLLSVSSRIFDWFAYDARGRSRLPRGIAGALLRWFWGVVAGSVGAAAFTTPILAFAFGYVPLYALLSNLLCLWAMSGAFLCGYAVCLLGLLWPAAGSAAGWLVGWLPRWTAFVVLRVARLPYAALCARGGLGQWWLLLVYALFAGGWALREKEPFRPALPLCASLVTFAALTFFIEDDLTGLLRVAAVDVGQGQSIVAMTERSAVVVDCGGGGTGTNAGDAAAEYLLRAGKNRVDLLILTHFHDDHVNGVLRLMGRVPVARLAIAAEYEDNDYSGRILAECARSGVAVYEIAENTRFTVDGVDWTVFAPLGEGSVNDAGLLIYGGCGENEILITGDAGPAVERTLARTYDLGDIELLVAGHHGAASSTTDILLDAVTPDVLFVSAGDGNSYGHPAQSVLERVSERSISLRRTDRDGTVLVDFRR